eukprot:248473-Rhodomonas_salina.1
MGVWLDAEAAARKRGGGRSSGGERSIWQRASWRSRRSPERCGIGQRRRRVGARRSPAVSGTCGMLCDVWGLTCARNALRGDWYKDRLGVRATRCPVLREAVALPGDE